MTTMAEIRKEERVRSFLRARIIFNNQNTTIDCVIKNISASGAKIELSNALSVPKEFDLDVPQRGRTYRARLTWRDAEAMGVEFIEGEAESRRALETRVNQLEGENRRLRATVMSLTKRLEEMGQDVGHDM